MINNTEVKEFIEDNKNILLDDDDLSDMDVDEDEEDDENDNDNEYKNKEKSAEQDLDKTQEHQDQTQDQQKELPPNYITFSNVDIYKNIFQNFNIAPKIPKSNNVCIISNEPAKYFDPLTKQYYSSAENFKILRERYFQKEEDNLLFRIQTLSDFASQKKERLKKMLLSSNTMTLNSNPLKTNNNNNMLDIVNKYGILKNESQDLEKKNTNRKIFSNLKKGFIQEIEKIVLKVECFLKYL